MHLETEQNATPGRAGKADLKPKLRLPVLPESDVWPFAGNSRRLLYGGLHDLGVSIESHDFESPEAVDWSRSFYADTLQLCLNLAGHGSICSDTSALNFEPLTAGLYSPGKPALCAQRQANQRHRFIAFEFSARFVREQTASCDGALHPQVEEFRRGSPLRQPLGQIHKLTAAQEQCAGHLLNPAVPQGARSLWYRGQVLEMMAEFFFEREGEDELFCDRQKRLSRERAARVAALLARDLAE